ncbi:MAG: GNAT family N-acetyltransferase [Sedimentisphaerales bacterium]|nr:GNAT family N-acetyltransferase [Sedimentisphaerales bacterium]
MPRPSRNSRILDSRRTRSAEKAGPRYRSVGSDEIYQTRIRLARPDEVDRALMLLLAEKNSASQNMAEHLTAFKATAAEGAYDLSRLQIVQYGNELVHAAFYVAQPGGTAMVLTSAIAPQAADNNAVWRSALGSLRMLADRAFAEGSRILQIMIDPADSLRHQLTLNSGFEDLTELIYMACLTAAPPTVASVPKDSRWQSYDQEHRDLFAHTVLRSYINSLDCNELESFRSIDDILEGHKAAGKFDPSLWRLLIKGDTPVGVLLLSPIPCHATLELTYMGVDPEFRGMGLGDCMVKEAQAAAARTGAESLSLAVDHRNSPAMKLYKNCGLIEILRRKVIVRTASDV